MRSWSSFIYGYIPGFWNVKRSISVIWCMSSNSSCCVFEFVVLCLFIVIYCIFCSGN